MTTPIKQNSPDEEWTGEQVYSWITDAPDFWSSRRISDNIAERHNTALRRVRAGQEEEELPIEVTAVSPGVNRKKEAVADHADSPPQNTLLPCPFCGQKAQLTGGPEWWVICKAIGVCQGNRMGGCTFKEDAIQLWNKRAAPSVGAGVSSTAAGVSLEKLRTELFQDGDFRTARTLAWRHPNYPNIDDLIDITIRFCSPVSGVEEKQDLGEPGTAKN